MLLVMDVGSTFSTCLASRRNCGMACGSIPGLYCPTADATKSLFHWQMGNRRFDYGAPPSLGAPSAAANCGQCASQKRGG